MSHMANQSIKSFKSKTHKKGSPMLTSLISMALQWAHPGFGGLSPGTGVISSKINSGECCIAFRLKVAKTQRNLRKYACDGLVVISAQASI